LNYEFVFLKNINIYLVFYIFFLKLILLKILDILNIKIEFINLEIKYKIKNILDHKINNKKIKYLIK